MSEKRETITRRAHLKSALIFLAFWLIIAHVLVKNIRDLGGVSGLVGVVRSGDYSDLVLMAFSIYLLAMFIRSLFKFFKFKDDATAR